MTRHPVVTRVQLVSRSRTRVKIHIGPDTARSGHLDPAHIDSSDNPGAATEPIEASLDVVAQLDIHVGTVLDPRMRKRLEEAQEKWAVRQAALNLLSYRPRAEQELRSRLRKKGHASGVVEWCLNELRTQGLLDDLAFGTAFARNRILLKPRGRSRILQELGRKGIRGEQAQQAVDRAFEETDTREVDLARTAAVSWLAKQPAGIREGLLAPFGSKERDRAYRRLLGYLQRRGFRGDAVRSAMDGVQETLLPRG